MKSRHNLKLLLLMVFLASILLSGCNMFTPDAVKTDSLEVNVKDQKFNQKPSLINHALPTQKLVISSENGKHEFEVEIAANDSQRKVGLMNRDKLDEDKGMFFIFEKSGVVNFWMKNTLIPLDIVFINEKGIIEHIARNVQPCKTPTCPLYNSYKSVRYVLEINGGKADRDGIKEGNKATWI